MNDPKMYALPEEILSNIYVGLCDCQERLEIGTMNVQRCINWLEDEHGFAPPKNYEED